VPCLYHRSLVPAAGGRHEDLKEEAGSGRESANRGSTDTPSAGRGRHPGYLAKRRLRCGHAQIAAFFLTAASFYSIHRLAAEGEPRRSTRHGLFTAAASVTVWIVPARLAAGSPVAALMPCCF